MTILLPLTRLLLLHLLFDLPRVVIAAESVATVAFFRAIQDKSVYSKSPTKYERIVVNDRAGIHEYYIEKQPAYVIPKIAIESVTVRDAEQVTATGQPVSETKSNSQSKSTRRAPRYFELIFKIKSPEGRKFSVFAGKNNQGSFEMVIGKHRLGLQDFDLPFEPDNSGGLEFKLYFLEADASNNSLKEMLSPYGNLVIWK